MTQPTFFVEEDKILTSLFDEGLDNLHLFKPDSEPVYSERLLTLLPNEYYDKITVQGNYYLKEEYKLHGIHIDSEEAPAPRGYKGHISRIEGLGYTEGVLVEPFDTPSYLKMEDAPSLDYELDLQAGDSVIEIRTLPTLHVYQGRDARYAVQIGDDKPQVFSIHADDFTAEWRWNVLRGYASRSIPVTVTGHQRLRIYLLDPGIVLQEILIHST